MKHANALESKSVWVCIVVNLSPLMMMANKKQNDGFEDKIGPF
jgi:hypothetical protein